MGFTTAIPKILDPKVPVTPTYLAADHHPGQDLTEYGLSAADGAGGRSVGLAGLAPAREQSGFSAAHGAQGVGPRTGTAHTAATVKVAQRSSGPRHEAQTLDAEHLRPVSGVHGQAQAGCIEVVLKAAGCSVYVHHLLAGALKNQAANSALRARRRPGMRAGSCIGMFIGKRRQLARWLGR